MDMNINKKLHDILTESGEESLALTKVRDSLGKEIKAALGIKDKNVSNLAKLLMPHLDGGLGISQSGNSFKLYTKRPVDPKTEIDFIFKKYAKNSILSFAELKKRMDSQLLDYLGLTAKSKNDDIKNAIEPHLVDYLEITKKGSSFVILRKIDIVKHVAEYDGVSLEKLRNDTKLPENYIICKVNALLEKGRLSVRFVKSGKAYKPHLYAVSSYEPEPRKQAGAAELPRTVSEDEFRRAFRKHDSGNFFVRICDIRRELMWSRDDFDDMLRRLRDECVIQLHVGDVSMMSEDEVNDSFIDENGVRMGTVTWNERENG